MTAEEKFNKAHEILENAIKKLKEIGFTRYALYAARPESWMRAHEDIVNMGAAAHTYGSGKEIVTGLAYLYGMICQDASKREREVLRSFTDYAFDAAVVLAKEDGAEDEDEDEDNDKKEPKTVIAINGIKISRKKAKNLTLEELMEMAIKQAEDGDED